jgi:hypothetical protein
MTTTDAVGTTVLFENDRIRPWEMVLGAGESCAPHLHLHDLLVYAEPETVRAEFEGRPVIRHVEDGLGS